MDDHGRWRCIHFNGIVNDRCKTGVEYDTVRSVVNGIVEYPCYNKDLSNCPSREYYTDEEWAKQQQRLEDILQQMTRFMAREIEDCYICGKHVDRLEKIGRCVYASPCGCRLWQGNVPKMWKV